MLVYIAKGNSVSFVLLANLYQFIIATEAEKQNRIFNHYIP